jgi:hypothetical protein
MTGTTTGSPLAVADRPWPESLVLWHATAARELNRHTAVDGLCQACGGAWPCVTCQQADLALGSS